MRLQPGDTPCPLLVASLDELVLLFPKLVDLTSEATTGEFSKMSDFFTGSRPLDLTTIKISGIICSSYRETLCGTAFARVFSKKRPGDSVSAPIPDSSLPTHGAEWKVP